MPKWKKEGIFLKPLWNFKCMGCKDPMAGFKEMGYILLNFPIYADKQKEYKSFALDRQYMCTLCGWQLNFGIAITEGHFKAIEMHDKAKGRGESLLAQRSINVRTQDS
jgi:hypothetical protein